LSKLLPKVWWLPFLGHSVFLIPFPVAYTVCQMPLGLLCSRRKRSRKRRLPQFVPYFGDYSRQCGWGFIGMLDYTSYLQ